MKQEREGRFLNVLAQICGALAAGFGLVALLGWVLNLPLLSSLGSHLIPMAPSTALLFVLLGVATYFHARLPQSRAAHRMGGMVIGSLGVFVSLLLLILSFLGIYPESEHLGFQINWTLNSTPVGHMSPVTALSFLLASLSFLALLSSAPGHPRRAMAALGLASLIILANYVLVLAYFVGLPLLYGGNIIPPALPTSLAFLALGIALLACARAQAGPRDEAMEAVSTRVPYTILLVFVVLVLSIVTVGYLYYRNYEQQFRTQEERQLSAITELKVSGLVSWRNEQLGDAEVLYHNPASSALVQHYFGNPEDAQAQGELQTWLESYQSYGQYDRARLLDTQGVTRLSAPAALPPISSAVLRLIPEVMQTGQITLVDFYRNETDRRIYMSVLIPIEGIDNHRIIGIIALRIDPEMYLYPYINEWPISSTTAENLLIRRDGEDALYLNELKFQADTALNLRTPLEDTQVLAAKAVLGETGIMEGVDYRGVAVIGYARAVPNSPWYLVARIDTAEIYAPLRARLWQSVIFFGALILVSGAGLMVVWRQQRVRYYRAQAESAEALRESEERYRSLYENSTIGIYRTTPDGKILLANASLVNMLGYSSFDELSARDLSKDGYEPSYPRARFLELMEKENEARGIESAWQRRDGNFLFVRESARAIRNPQGEVLFYDGTVEDITERKQAEMQVRLQSTALNAAANAIVITDRAGSIQWTNPAWTELTGYALEDVLGQNPRLLKSGIQDEAFYKNMWDTILAGKVWHNELVNKRKDGSLYNEEETITPLLDAQGQITHFIGIKQDITERKQIEKKLLTSEARYRRLFEAARDGILILNAETGTVIDVNPFLIELLGFSQNAFLGKALWELGFFKDIAVNKANFLELQQKGFIQYESLPMETADGRSIQVEFVSHVYQVDHHKVIQCNIRDITERKRAEQALRDSQAQVTGIFNSAMDAIITVDEEQKIIIFNPSAEQMFGCLASEALGQAFDRFMPETVRKKHREYLRVFGQTNSTKRSMKTPALALTCLRADGEAFPSEVSISQLEIGGKKLYTAIVRDITERKRAEEKLTASEVRYRRLFEAARDGILILNAETGIVIDVNPFLVEMLGFSQEEILGKALWELGFFKDIAANKANFLKLQQEEYIRYEDLPLETADGRRFRVEFVSNVYQVDHHKVIQCNIRDITERKQAEQQLANYAEHLEDMVDQRTHQLREAQEQLVRQERLAMLGQLAGSIGHELRNPLGVISNAVYFLKMSLPDANDTIREYLDIIENETRASDKIVTDLLDFTRIKSLDRQPVAVSELVRQTLERYPAPPSVEVTLEIAPDLPPVYADPQHILQVLGNLTVNACQSMVSPAGTMSQSSTTDVGKLIISAAAQSDMISIAVQDTGMGIPPENIKKLFEPLFTTKTKGIGLGLAVSWKLAEANGGRIEVQSEPGKGSTFTLVLPIHKELK